MNGRFTPLDSPERRDRSHFGCAHQRARDVKRHQYVTHVVQASGPCHQNGIFGQSRTAIDHPLIIDKPDAILVVTASIGVRAQNGSLCMVPALARRLIDNPNADQSMVAGMKNQPVCDQFVARRQRFHRDDFCAA